MFYDLLIFIFMSYIKPQQIAYLCTVFKVVYRTIPTSNHNPSSPLEIFGIVVYRTIPTSNHNPSSPLEIFGIVVYRTIPTSNHNLL